MNDHISLDKVKGSTLGLAIGDALGYPVEFMRLEQITKKFGKVTDFESASGLDKGSISDDTQMTLAVTYGIIDSGENYSLDNIMKNVSKRFVEDRKSVV